VRRGQGAPGGPAAGRRCRNAGVLRASAGVDVGSLTLGASPGFLLNLGGRRQRAAIISPRSHARPVTRGSTKGWLPRAVSSVRRSDNPSACSRPSGTGIQSSSGSATWPMTAAPPRSIIGSETETMTTEEGAMTFPTDGSEMRKEPGKRPDRSSRVRREDCHVCVCWF
jgi:hypothetical protein